jgi:uncharacterized membrane protein YbhN (UPF0104 family)
MIVGPPCARWRRLVRGGLLAVTGGFIVWSLVQQWDAMRQSAGALHPHWGWIAAASLLVLGTHALLVQAWRQLLAGWGGTLSYPMAIRIWTIANLGRWIPGKVWSVGALGVLAREQGVSGVAAAGAAVLGTLLNIGAGFGIAVLVGASALETLRPGLRSVALAVAMTFGCGLLILPWGLPPLLRTVARWRGQSTPDTAVPARTLWAVTVVHALSWVGYGVAFAWFAAGVTPQVSGNPLLFIAVFTVSYLVGYLALFSPGGLGVREYALAALLVGLGVSGSGDAVVLGVTSRVWLTVLEVAPGLASLLWMTPEQRRSLESSA